MAVQVLDNYGQVRVTGADKGKPLAKVYVKVYARWKNGQICSVAKLLLPEDHDVVGDDFQHDLTALRPVASRS